MCCPGVERQLSGSGSIETRNAIEYGGLPRAVWSDERGYFPIPGVEGNVIDGDQTAKMHGKMFDTQ